MTTKEKTKKKQINKKETKLLTCTFCGEQNKQNPEMAFIEDSQTKRSQCSDCINRFNFALKYIIDSATTENQNKGTDRLPLPSDIYQALNRDIIKQDDAKKAIANSVAHHYRRLRNPAIGKSNILLIGKTGTGKTEIVRSVARYLNVPFAIADASAFTARGYIGEDAESAIRRLLISANWDVAAAENGIVFIDEVDKIAKKDGQDSGVGTTSVQQQLLKILEGDTIQIKIPSNEEGKEQFVLINTSKILFICSGAFVGLEDIIKKGSASLRPLGLHAHLNDNSVSTELKSENPLKLVTPQHLEKYGLIPEFLGRVPVITSTDPLSVEDLVRILKEPQNSIVKQYQMLFEQDNIELNFHENFLTDVATEAHRKDIGARGLRQVIEQKMQKIFFEVDKYQGKRIEINKDCSVSEFGNLSKPMEVASVPIEKAQSLKMAKS